MQRLEALRDLKLKLQIFVVGSIIAMFAELFSVELTASAETTKEEGRNTEKTSAKEATKEVHENLEIKVDAKEKPQLKYDIIPALDAESWLKKPITLTKQEHDLLPKSLKDILPPVPKDDMNKGNSGEPKQEVKEKQGNENKKPTQPAQEPSVAVPKVLGESTAKESGTYWEWPKVADNEMLEKINLGRGSAKKLRRGANTGLPPNPKNFPKVDQFQVPSETNDNGKFSAEREPQRSSVNSAQPPSEFDNVKVTGGQSVEKGR